MAEFYPVPLAGQKITAALLRSMLPQVARKTSDTQRAATTTPAADTHLFFTVEANAVYTWNGWLKYSADIAADITLDFSSPTGSLGEWVGHGAGVSNVIGSTDSDTPVLQDDVQETTGYMIRTEANDVAQARSFGGLGSGVALTIFLYGTLRTSSTAGTFSLDWSQLASSATATTVFTDSWLSLQRIA